MLRGGTGEGTPLCHSAEHSCQHSPLESQSSIPAITRGTGPSLPWKIKPSSSDTFTRHQECLTLAATSMAWSPTALRGGRRSVSTESCHLVLAQHLAPFLLSAEPKPFAGEKGKGQHTTVHTLQRRDPGADPRTGICMDRLGVPTLPGALS